ncbi:TRANSKETOLASE_1 domain-containing protein [Meloidogyne graminicola]|uniref:transketolase n=1 Tax=Meloidogyne graminicola TaxID=189291 RepID=A0A8S9ZZZ2_9BILA|nr:TRANSKETOLASE_1 domain-containing protein [Meloidogyne graminicola]
MRVSSIEQTAKANSEIVSTLFFSEMRYFVKEPRHPAADRFENSSQFKGHACPILYAAWEEAGLLTHEQVLSLRKLNSDIEGHPTPRLEFIDVATGSLGQGLSCAAGMAYVGKYIDNASYRVYCLLGDSESAEGSVWEAAAFASYYKLDNLVAIVDVNRLGQSRETMLGHDLFTYAKRFEAFGFHSIVVDGHDITALLKAYDEAKTITGQPTAIIARTLKGKGIEGIEDKDNCHGKPVTLEKAEIISSKLINKTKINWEIQSPMDDVVDVDFEIGKIKMSSPPNYSIGEKVATRLAYGNALVKLADTNKRIIALDGDVSNSTFSDKVLNKYPEQFVQCFIAEQNMVGVAVGMSCRGRTIPHASTFAVFFTRAADQIRMGAISFANVKFAGSHAGVSIGEDGPSQMGLEDLALFRSVPNSIVLYPTDAVSAEYATELAVNYKGITFTRTGRPNTPVIYPNDEKFEIGKCKVIRQTKEDKYLLIGAGVTLYECIKAHDMLNSEGIKVLFFLILIIFKQFFKPLDTQTIAEQAKRVGGKVLTVEDHYQTGGIGEAVALALGEIPQVCVRSLCVKEIPRSGTPDELMDLYGISAKKIVAAVKDY